MDDLQPASVLGLDGWVFTPKEKMDALFMDFVSANKSQSVSAKDLTYSYQYILAMWQGSEQKLMDDLQFALKQYFGGYYTKVEASVRLDRSATVGDALDLQIFLEATDGYGKTFNLAKVLQDFTSKSSQWVNLNNYGDPGKFVE
jgi:hypothetical protein